MTKPVYVLNGTTLVMGGAIQACVNFIGEACQDNEVTWKFLISPQIDRQLAACNIFLNSESVQCFESSPAKSLSARKSVRGAVDSIDPEAVFTFFGPSYVSFKCKHFLGFADPWVLHPNEYANKLLYSAKQKIKTYLLCAYKRFWLMKADAWFVETTAAQAGLVKLAACSTDDVAVVANGCRDIFNSIEPQALTSETKEINLLYLSAYYPHKNFELVPYVALVLKKLLPEYKFVFTLSISADNKSVKSIEDAAKANGVADNIKLIGGVSLDQVATLYQESHIAFIPTLLEVFSAAYSEAMTCGLPVVTSDLDFSRSVCIDAGFYFTPNNPEAAAQAIVQCVQDHERRNDIVKKAKLLAGNLPNANQKYLQYKQFIIKKVGG